MYKKIIYPVDTYDFVQIDSREYAVRGEADGRKVNKCSKCIGSKQRTITHWKMTDNEGHTLQEKIFK